MSLDPLVSASGDCGILQRLLRENKELREANALLRISSEAKTTGNNGKASSKIYRGDIKGQGGQQNKKESKAASTAATVKKLNEELRHAKEELEKVQCEQKKSVEEYGQLKSVFESFVVEVCEREEVCKLVFSRLFEEMEEHKKMCETLQRLLQERPQTAVTPAVVPKPVVVGMDPANLRDIVDSFSSLLGELQSRLGYTGVADGCPKNAVTAPHVVKKRGNSRAIADPSPGVDKGDGGRRSHEGACSGATATASSNNNNNEHDDGGRYHRRVQEMGFPVLENAARVVEPVKGAGALRTAGLPNLKSVITERKKRGRKQLEGSGKLKQQAVEQLSASDSASLFKTIAPTAVKVRRPVVNFGSEPIADYLALLEKTDTGRVDVLRGQLMSFCSSDVKILASYAVEHFLSKPILEAPVMTLWKHTDLLMQVSVDLFCAFVKQIVRKLVCFLGAKNGAAVDHSQHVRCLALVVRMACVVRLRDNAPIEDALFMAFYECTVSALRTWRVVSSVRAQQHVLGLWMVASRYLCGFVEDFHMVMRYYANSEGLLEVLKLPNSLSRYALQGVMSSCYSLSSQPQQELLGKATSVDSDTWMAFCDAMNWSYSLLPLDMIGSAAAKILATSDDVFKRGEALLSLRLLVLHRGFGFLQTLTEELKAFVGEVDIDAVFAELFSLAVIDLQLEDPRDEQWGRAMAFFVDYLGACSVEHAKSAEEFLVACKDTHLLVLRAVLQLCYGSGTIKVGVVEQLATALCWAKALKMCIARVRDGTTPFAITLHPFEGSELGKELCSFFHEEL